MVDEFTEMADQLNSLKSICGLFENSEEESLLEVIRRTGIINKDQKAQLIEMFTGVAEAEVRQGADLVKAAYLTIKGKKAENQAKEQEVDELFTNIIKSNGGK